MLQETVRVLPGRQALGLRPKCGFPTGSLASALGLAAKWFSYISNLSHKDVFLTVHVLSKEVSIPGIDGMAATSRAAAARLA